MSQIPHGTYLGLSSSDFTEETNISLPIPHTLHICVLTHSDGSHSRPQTVSTSGLAPMHSCLLGFCTVHSPSPLCIFNFWSPRGLLFSRSSTHSSLPQFFKPSPDPPIPLPFPSCSDTSSDVSPSLNFPTSPCPINSPLSGHVLLNSRTLLLLQSSMTFLAFTSQVPSFFPS